MPNWCDNTATITFPTNTDANAFKAHCDFVKLPNDARKVYVFKP